LPLHLRKEHKYSHESSISAVGQFGLRKQTKVSSAKYKHQLKQCPLPLCYATTKNPGEHLRSKKHNIFKDHPGYKDILKDFKPYDPSAIPEQLKESPKKNFGVRHKVSDSLTGPNKNYSNNKNFGMKISPSVSTISAAPVSAEQLTQNASTVPVMSIASTESVTPIESFSPVTFEPIVSDFNDMSAELSSPIASTVPTTVPTVLITPIAFDPVTSDDDISSNLSEESTDNKSSDDEYIDDDPDLDKVIMQFKEFMTGPNRGRNVKSINAVAGDVRRILREIRCLQKEDWRNVLLNEEFILKYVRTLEERGILPGSVKKYLSSFRDFTRYLTNLPYEAHSLNTEKLRRLDYLLGEWRKKLKRKDNLQGQKRKADDQEMLLTSNQVARYDTSEINQTAQKIFEELKLDPNYRISLKIFTCLRDHVIIEICLANAHRSGVICNMRMGEFSKFQITERGLYRIGVWDHKTVESYGHMSF